MSRKPRNTLISAILVTLLSALLSQSAFSQDGPLPQLMPYPVNTQIEVVTPPPSPLLPVEKLEAYDSPDDSGNAIILAWPIPGDEKPEQKYIIEAASDQSGPWRQVATFNASTSFKADLPRAFTWNSTDLKTMHAIEINMAPPTKAFRDMLDESNYNKTLKLKETLKQIEDSIKDMAQAEKDVFADQIAELKQEIIDLENAAPVTVTLLDPDHYYHFRVIRSEGERLSPPVSVGVIPRGNWFDFGKLNNFVIAIMLAGLILFYVYRARKKPENIFIRRIPGLEAVEDAIGRATEMGKPIFFVHGLADMSSISTVASVNILGKITERVAEYGTAFKVTNKDPVVLAVSQETVKEAYLRMGRPDLYRDDDVFFVSQDQFSYATGVEGMILREQPASIFYFGYYFAEALLLTETGAHMGAIQIAGTDSYTQLPFFITTCDYTLMGEELYAASAYLSRDPKLLASLKGQDLMKGLIIIFILAGIILSTAGVEWIMHVMESF